MTMTNLLLCCAIFIALAVISMPFAVCSVLGGLLSIPVLRVYNHCRTRDYTLVR